MTFPYYKKVDRSLFELGVTLPKENVKSFEGNACLSAGTSRSIEVVLDNKRYIAKLVHVKRKKYNPIYQIRWDNNRELLKKLRKTFIQSYIILKSQKELFDLTKKERKHFRTQLVGGQQEVLILRPVTATQVKFEVFIKINNEWNSLFERLAEENVFGWIYDKDKKYLISRSTNWFSVTDFTKHKNATNVIYYLANTRKKLLYIGKAEILGKRVKLKKQHQNMPKDWDKFRYDIVKPEYANLLERIEDHTIRAFASILRNTKNYPSLGLGDYKLVNSNWKKL